MAATNESIAKKKNNANVISLFMAGAKKGFYLCAEIVAPALILAYVLVQFLTITGLMTIIGNLVAPIMGVFGLPGEAIVALVAAFFAKAAGVATVATMYETGTLTAIQATIMFPAVITMGTLLAGFVRVIIVANVNERWHKILLVLPVIDAFISMWITKLILIVMGIH